MKTQPVWADLATKFYALPSRPSVSAIAFQIRDVHGHADATAPRVRRALMNLGFVSAAASTGRHHCRQAKRK